jgi:8-oxo-dGTP pyrophosphatase MutT (NUDIX family)
VTQPNEHRETARVLLRRTSGEVFLLLTHFDPEVGLPPRWITPGGGIESTESVRAAAIRELFEETGLRITDEMLGSQVGEFSGRWTWADGVNSHSYKDYIFELFVEDFTLDDSDWTTDEHRDILEHRWWTPEQLTNSKELFGPHGLVEFILNR